MATQIVSAETNPTNVIIKEGGAKGELGDTGANGTGLNDIRYGLLANPLCHLLKTNDIAAVSAPLNTDADVSVSRASIATYIDFYGVVQTAAINELRQKAAGWLIEDASTNISLWSENFNNTGWSKTNLTATLGESAPDGSNNASLLVSSDFGAYISHGVASQPASVYTVSIFVKKVGATDIAQIVVIAQGFAFATADYNFSTDSFTAVANGAENPTSEILKDEWVRISVSIPETTAVGTVSMRLYPNGSGTIGDMQAFGGMIEVSPILSSYIKTTSASVTRARDAVSCVTYNNITPNNLTISLSVNYAGAIDTRGSILAFDTTPSIATLNYLESGARLEFFNGVEALVIDTAFDKNVVNDIALTFNNGTMNYYKNGMLHYTYPLSVGDIYTGGLMIFGSGNTGGINHFNGTQKDFRVYDFALNLSEIAYLNGA